MLLNTWGNMNKVISQPLQTTWKREHLVTTLPSVTGNIDYWHYTRIRTMQYRYVGMDMQTAIRCAKAINAMYNRLHYKQVVSTSGWSWNVAESGKIWTQCGNASIRYEAGSAYAVDVQLAEELTYNIELARPWTAFE